MFHLTQLTYYNTHKVSAHFIWGKSAITCFTTNIYKLTFCFYTDDNDKNEQEFKHVKNED